MKKLNVNNRLSHLVSVMAPARAAPLNTILIDGIEFKLVISINH